MRTTFAGATLLLAILLACVLLVAGCQNPMNDPANPDPGVDPAGTDPVDTDPVAVPPETTVQGTLPAGSYTASATIRSTGPAIDAALLFYGDSVVREPITDGTFSLPVSSEEPAGIVFVGSDNSYQGYVSIRDASNVLPLQAVGDEPVLIDLGELSLPQAGESGVGHKFGHSSDLSAYLPNADENLLASMDGASALFSSVVENPDFDGNGIVDLLEGVSIDATLVYYTGTLGSFGADLTPPINFDPSNMSHKILISTQFEHVLSNATMLRPGESAPTDVSDVTGSSPQLGFWFGGGEIGFQGFSAVPSDGAYVFRADYTDETPQTIDYTFRVPTGVSSIIERNLLILRPTVALANGNVTSVSWDVLNPDGTPVDNPELILTEVEVQIDGASSRIYDSGWVAVADGAHTLTTPIVWADVGAVYLAYNDRFGNHYVNQYSK